jgi:tungstate transport system permease protein
MNDFSSAFCLAVALIGRFDVGTALAVYRFRGRGLLVVLANALLGLPAVVVGLTLLLSRSGPLGPLGLLFTPTAMIIAQTALAVPIVVALVHRVAVGLWRTYGDSLLISGHHAFAPSGR